MNPAAGESGPLPETSQTMWFARVRAVIAAAFRIAQGEAVGGWAGQSLLTIYYVSIILALILLYGRGDFSTPPFVYQGF
jgi:hypothetical protein